MNRVTLFGQPTVDATPLYGQRALLFAYLVLNRGRLVNRHELLEALNDERPLPKDPEGALSQQLWHLRRELGSEVLPRGAPQLRLVLARDVWIDAEVIRAHARRARSALQDEAWGPARDSARSVLELTRPGLLSGHDARWLDDIRREFAELELDALECQARAGLAIAGNADLADARDAARTMIARDPYREPAVRLLMEILEARGSAPEALQVYDEFRLGLQELGMLPSEGIRQLHDRLLKGGATLDRPVDGQEAPVPYPVEKDAERHTAAAPLAAGESAKRRISPYPLPAENLLAGDREPHATVTHAINMDTPDTPLTGGSPPRLIFVTGFPGFLGRRLVASLVDADPAAKIAAIVEPRMAKPARTAAAQLDPHRIEILEGDITDRRLGLRSEDYERLAAETIAAYHLAAVYDLAVPAELGQRVNVEGTRNVLEWSARCERLERLSHVSTAFVSGTRHGVVYEHELALGQGFKNHYESTKFQAELLVRHRMDDIPITVHRPATVVGDSRTGETQKFDGAYYLLRVVSLAKRLGLPLPQLGTSTAPLNLVPIDFVVQAIIAAAGDSSAIGETLHLVDPDPLLARDVLRLLSQHYAGMEPAWRLPLPLMEQALRLPAARRVFGGAPREAIRYLSHPVRFDARHTEDLLGRHDLRCPRFKEYSDAIVGFFPRHEDDPAYAPA